MSRHITNLFFLGEAISDELDLDLSSYNEAISDKDSGNWQSDMKVEMEFMYSNHVWKIIELLINVKLIGCKSVYKRKRGPNGSVETFKGRLVAKGFTEKEGIDYEKTFSPVSMLKSIIALLYILAHFDYEI